MDKNIVNLRRFLKARISDNAAFVGHPSERNQVLDLLQKTIEHSESNSALLIGPRGSGKTTLVNDVLRELEEHFATDGTLVKLHGLVHTDDRLALKAITTQMGLDNAVDGKVFGSFADNLAFLLACLKSGQRGTSKSVIFVLDEFDLFCLHNKQTLLYNLFDVSQSAQTPICVLGITCRLDVVELLEKRVKSRFSHRQLFLFPGKEEDSKLTDLEHRLRRLEDFLLVPNDEISMPTAFKKDWNAHIRSLLKDSGFKRLMQHLLDIDLGEKTLRNLLMMVVSQIDGHNLKLKVEAFQKEVRNFEMDDTVQVLKDLSVLELCLVIAMKHHCDIYDNQPMNFEMLLTRYTKFANAHCTIQSVKRSVIMKAFEHIQNLELISMVNPGCGGVQREYQMFQFLVEPKQVSEAVRLSTGLPTEVVQWAGSSII